MARAKRRGSIAKLRFLCIVIILCIKAPESLFRLLVLILDLVQSGRDLFERFLFGKFRDSVLVMLLAVVLHAFATVPDFDHAYGCGRAFEEVTQRGEFGQVLSGTADGRKEVGTRKWSAGRRR